MPGVYMQGLLIYNADGTLMHEESLSEDIVKETIKLAKELGMLPCLRPNNRLQLSHCSSYR